MGLTFSVGGRTVDADTFIAGAMKGAPRVAKEQKAEFHKGWSVEGYPPGFVAAAQAQAEAEFAKWWALDDEQRAAKIKSGRRLAKAWDLASWKARTKLKKVRSRPYEVRSAADECAKLAEKSGWTDVCVVTLQKGELHGQASLIG